MCTCGGQKRSSYPLEHSHAHSSLPVQSIVLASPVSCHFHCDVDFTFPALHTATWAISAGMTLLQIACPGLVSTPPSTSHLPCPPPGCYGQVLLPAQGAALPPPLGNNWVRGRETLWVRLSHGSSQRKPLRGVALPSLLLQCSV